jgi:hypothetical protein
VDILSSRILLRPSDLDRSRRFYGDVLGLAIYREFGPPDDPGVVFFLGPGLLEVSGHAAGPAGRSVMIWLRHEAQCCIACLAGRDGRRNLWIRWLTWSRKVKGTVACQETGGRAQASGTVRRGIRAIWRKLDCLKPSLQKV